MVHPFGLHRVKLLIRVLHWVQEQDQCYQVTSFADITDADEFCQVIEVSIQWAALQKVEDDEVDTISKAADPEKFKDEPKWLDWKPAFINYLSMISGSYH